MNLVEISTVQKICLYKGLSLIPVSIPSNLRCSVLLELIMALHQQVALFSHTILLPFQMKPSFSTKCSYLPRPIQCMTTTPTDFASDHLTIRRSANFQPSIWHYNYIQSLKSEYLVRFSSLIFLSFHIFF